MCRVPRQLVLIAPSQSYYAFPQGTGALRRKWPKKRSARDRTRPGNFRTAVLFFFSFMVGLGLWPACLD